MQEKPKNLSRRSFLKSSAAAGSVVAASGALSASKSFAATTAWAPGTPVNPNIPDTRVVYCKDLSMMTNQSNTPPTSFKQQNDSLNSAKIKSNLDNMAITLAQKSTANDAWKTIFQCPSGKAWNACKVYIKVNAADSVTMPHIPIVSKVCEELIRLGILSTNIEVADPSRNARRSTQWPEDKYEQYVNNGLPSGVVVRNEEYPCFASSCTQINTPDRISNKAELPNKWPGTGAGARSVYVTKALYNNGYLADIIVNIATCKGHTKSYMGGCTMTMKNHVGTFGIEGSLCPGKPYSATSDVGTSDMITWMSKHEVIMGGGTPAYPCRQQLCIVDALWLKTDGPHFAFDRCAGYIVMGTSSPCVDYLTYDKVRKALVADNLAGNSAVLAGFVTAFNHTTAELTTGWIPAATTSVIDNQASHGRAGFSVNVVSGSNAHGASVHFDLPADVKRLGTIKIYNSKGRLVRDLGGINADHINWDGLNMSGKAVPAGSYIVRINHGSQDFSKSLSLTN